MKASTKRIKQNKNTKTVEITTKNVGLPAKSYMWILTLDYHIKTLLSFICKKQAFEDYITSLLKKHYRTKDNKREVIKYLNFLVISDETRLYSIYPSKTLTRQEAIKFIFLLKKDIDAANSFKLRLYNSKQYTQQEAKDYTDFMRCWGTDEYFVKLVNDTHNNIQEVIVKLHQSFSSLIMKKLLHKNALNATPEELQYHVYDIIMEMVDQYIIRRKEDYDCAKQGLGKVPFTTQLDWIIKAKKTLILEGERHELNNKAISINQEDGLDNLIADQSEFSSGKEELYEFVASLIPKPFFQLYEVYNRQFQPLTTEEQLNMMVAYHNGSN